MDIKIIKEKITREELQTIAEKMYGTVVKIAVDIEKEIIALDGEWHAECQEALIESGSDAQDIWGANIKIKAPREDRIEYFALINIKPSVGHQNMEVTDKALKEKIKQVVDRLIE